jgi:putative transposase
MPKSYPSDMTDQEWEIIKPLIPAAKKGGRRRSVDIRKILNAIFYINKGGIQWAMLPKDFPPMSTVYWYFARWKREGTIEKIHDKLRKIVRVTEAKKPEPTAGIIDSQSSKTTEEARSIKGFDAGKKNKGKKKTYHR